MQYYYGLLNMNTPFDNGFPVPFVYHSVARCEGDGILVGMDSGKPRSAACKDHVLKHKVEGLALVNIDSDHRPLKLENLHSMIHRLEATSPKFRLGHRPGG